MRAATDRTPPLPTSGRSSATPRVLSTMRALPATAAATPISVKRIAAQRPEMPLILCEYSHAMGNSSGGLKEYWDIFYSGTNAQGAFVWDWVDQGIRLPVPGEYKSNTSASTFLAYGGWWEDKTGIRNDND